MTIDTIINELLDEMERPDLYDSCEMYVPEALRKAHGCRKFYKDLAEVVLPDPVIDENNRVRYFVGTDLPKLREIQKVQLYQGYTEPTPGEYSPYNEIFVRGGFLDRAKLHSVYDYYGFERQYLYSRVGAELVLQGVSSDTQAVKFTMFAWPTVTRNAATQKLETPSWIVEEWPELVKAHLRKKLIVVVNGKRDEKSSADGMIIEAQTDLLNGNIDGWDN